MKKVLLIVLVMCTTIVGHNNVSTTPTMTIFQEESSEILTDSEGGLIPYQSPSYGENHTKVLPKIKRTYKPVKTIQLKPITPTQFEVIIDYD